MRYGRRDGVIAERSGERTVVLDSDGTTLITLSPVGALVWEQLPCDHVDAVGDLQRRFPDVPEDVLDRDVSAFFAELLANSLIIEIDAAG